MAIKAEWRQMISSVGEEVEKLSPGDIRNSLKRFIVGLVRWLRG